MIRTPIHPPEEYIEQAYLFRTCRERRLEGVAMQDVLSQVDQEILSTTKLPFAVSFMLDEMRHSGRISQACARLPHYFTPFQSFVLEQAEREESTLTFEQALQILEREAEYRASGAAPAGLFFFEIEAMSRNRLGYMEGLDRMEGDGLFNDDWLEFLQLIRAQLGLRDLPEMVFARSQAFVELRRRDDPKYQPPFTPLFGEKEGRIAAAGVGRDPMYFFAALQRQLGYPAPPRPRKDDALAQKLEKMSRAIQRQEEKLRILEQEVRGQVDLSQFTVGEDGQAPIDKRLGPIEP